MASQSSAAIPAHFGAAAPRSWHADATSHPRVRLRRTHIAHPPLFSAQATTYSSSLRATSLTTYGRRHPYSSTGHLRPAATFDLGAAPYLRPFVALAPPCRPEQPPLFSGEPTKAPHGHLLIGAKHPDSVHPRAALRRAIRDRRPYINWTVLCASPRQPNPTSVHQVVYPATSNTADRTVLLS